MTTTDTQTEAALKEEIKQWCFTRKIYNVKDMAQLVAKGEPIVGFFFMKSQNAYSVSGIADFTLCVMGQFVTVETKRRAKRQTLKPRKNQENYAKLVRLAGGHSIVTDSLEKFTYFMATTFGVR